MMNENKDPENKGGSGGGGKEGEGQPDARDEAIKKLTDQVANLTKGIATYRDEAQAASAAAKEADKRATEAVEEAKKAAKGKVELDPKDEAKFKAWADEQGYLTKEAMDAERVRLATESFKTVQTTAVAEFLEKHPEYDDDEKWKEIDSEFKLYKTPTTLPEFRKLLERIHKDVSGDKGTSDRARAEARAELKRRELLQKGGGSQGAGGSGDHEADIDKLQQKYPNLSRDQIEQRLAEINALYPKK